MKHSISIKQDTHYRAWPVKHQTITELPIVKIVEFWFQESIDKLWPGKYSSWKNEHSFLGYRLTMNKKIGKGPVQFITFITSFCSFSVCISQSIIFSSIRWIYEEYNLLISVSSRRIRSIPDTQHIHFSRTKQINWTYRTSWYNKNKHTNLAIHIRKWTPPIGIKENKLCIILRRIWNIMLPNDALNCCHVIEQALLYKCTMVTETRWGQI